MKPPFAHARKIVNNSVHQHFPLPHKVPPIDLPLVHPLLVRLLDGRSLLLVSSFRADERTERALVCPRRIVVAQLADTVVDEDVRDAEDEGDDVA